MLVEDGPATDAFSDESYSHTGQLWKSAESISQVGRPLVAHGLV